MLGRFKKCLDYTVLFCELNTIALALSVSLSLSLSLHSQSTKNSGRFRQWIRGHHATQSIYPKSIQGHHATVNLPKAHSRSSRDSQSTQSPYKVFTRQSIYPKSIQGHHATVNLPKVRTRSSRDSQSTQGPYKVITRQSIYPKSVQGHLPSSQSTESVDLVLSSVDTRSPPAS